MFLKNQYASFVLFCIILLTTQCISETEIDLPVESNSLVFVSHPEPGFPIRGSLGISSSVISNNYLLPTDLLPVFSVLEGNRSFDVLRQFPGSTGDQPFWEGAANARKDSTYTITIETPGYPIVTAQTTIPKPSVPKITVDMNNFVPVISGDKVIKRIPLTISLGNISQTDSFFVFNVQFVKFNNVDSDYRQSDAHFLALGSTLAYLHPMPDNSLLIEKNFWNTTADTTLKIDIVVDYMLAYENPYKLIIDWRTVSKEYYFYYLSLSRQGNVSLPFSDPDILYNNIKGGYGTFSGFSRTYREIML